MGTGFGRPGPPPSRTRCEDDLRNDRSEELMDVGVGIFAVIAVLVVIAFIRVKTRARDYGEDEQDD